MYIFWGARLYSFFAKGKIYMAWTSLSFEGLDNSW